MKGRVIDNRSKSLKTCDLQQGNESSRGNEEPLKSNYEQNFHLSNFDMFGMDWNNEHLSIDERKFWALKFPTRIQCDISKYTDSIPRYLTKYFENSWLPSG